MRESSLVFIRGVALGLTILAGCAAHAEDSSVAERLSAQGMKYEVDSEGDFKFVYDYSKEGRTQLVFVSGATATIGNLVIREVFAPAAMVGKDKIDGARALELLNNSGYAKLGSWEIRGDIVYFVIKVFDDIGAAELEAVIDIAAETADNMEIELTEGRDDL